GLRELGSRDDRPGDAVPGRPDALARHEHSARVPRPTAPSATSGRPGHADPIDQRTGVGDGAGGGAGEPWPPAAPAAEAHARLRAAGGGALWAHSSLARDTDA